MNAKHSGTRNVVEKSLFTALTALSLAAGIISVCAMPVQAQKKPLQGTVNQNDFVRPDAGPSLNRNDIERAGDPFAGSAPAAEQFDAPEAAFDSQTPVAPPPPFNLNAQDGGFDGQGMNPMGGQMGQLPMDPAQMGQQMMLQPPQRPVDPNDPDSSQAMQIAWDEWHKRVAEAIFVRFDQLAQKAFANSRGLACQVTYTVTRDRQITNPRILTKSPNIVFNSMLLLVLKSMNGNPILEFPAGSRRMQVEKAGTFSRNMGVQGFKYTTGDYERQQRMQQQQQGHR